MRARDGDNSLINAEYFFQIWKPIFRLEDLVVNTHYVLAICFSHGHRLNRNGVDINGRGILLTAPNDYLYIEDNVMTILGKRNLK